MIELDPSNAFGAAFMAAVGWTLGRIAADLLRRFGLVIYNLLVRLTMDQPGPDIAP